jgi:hypothetical protein
MPFSMAWPRGTAAKAWCCRNVGTIDQERGIEQQEVVFFGAGTEMSWMMVNKCVIRFVMLAAVSLLALGCGETGPARAPVAGKVTVDGKPLAAGRVLFTPQAPNHGPTTSARIANGEYKLPKEEGPVVGQNRVEVEADLNIGFALDDEAAFAKRGKPLPPNPIPPAFNRDSTLSLEVKPGIENVYDVSVPGSVRSASRP